MLYLGVVLVVMVVAGQTHEAEMDMTANHQVNSNVGWRRREIIPGGEVSK